MERVGIEECRQILGPEACDLTDDEVSCLRESLYALAEICLEAYSSPGHPQHSVSTGSRDDQTLLPRVGGPSPAWQEPAERGAS